MIETVLSCIDRGGSGISAESIRLIVHSDDPRIEPALLSVVERHRAKHSAVALASRVLVERDPERDPEFLLKYFLPVNRLQEEHPGVGSFLQRYLAEPPPTAYMFGFAKLRRAQPVAVYSKLLEAHFFGVRSGAAVGLGDTGDTAALDPLAKALRDPHPLVRTDAADAVRRLRHAGAAEVLPTHPVRDGLITCLTDGRSKVRVAAARALGSMEDLEPLRQRRTRTTWWARRRRRELDRVLRGEIPPLPKLWPGDETT